MRCVIKNGKVELVGFEEGTNSATEFVQRTVFELHSQAIDLGKVRAPESAISLANELGETMKRRENKAVQVHDSLDPRKVFELLQTN
jgi:hypothetical protein